MQSIDGRNPQTDSIFLEDIKIEAWIGWYEWERQHPQTLLLQLEIGLPHQKAAYTDDLKDTIDYAAVLMRLRQDLKAQHFLLLEALAEHMAQVILQDFSASWVTIRVAKLGILAGVKQVGVKIYRTPTV